MYLNFIKLIFGLTLFVFISCNNKPQSQQKTSQKIPGYYEQWLYIKTNGTNILPEIKDKSSLLNSNKRSSSNAIQHLKEYGPFNTSGRYRAMIIDKQNPNRFIVGGASGGIFVSENKGGSWAPINDHSINPSVTFMDQNTFTPNIIYYCTGESTGNSADIFGAGIFKSTDGGKTFNQLPATNNNNFRFNWSLKCSLKDTNTLFVSTNNTGLWRSVNAGATFQKVHNTSLQINDIEVFTDGSIMIAIKGQGVFRSETGDLNSFTKVNSIVSTSTARGELAYCKNFPNVVYAAISGPDNSYNGVLNQFYKSSDGGKTFVTKSNPNGIANFGFTWYTLTMTVKDNDSNSIFIGSVTNAVSKNGGNTWQNVNEQHADNHIAVNFNNQLYVGSDGGMCVYDWSNFQTFTSLNNGLNITQIYAGDVSPHSIAIMGGTQDNGTIQGLNNNKFFNPIFGGDGGHCFYNAQKQNSRYVSTQNGNVNYEFGSISDNLPTSDQRWFIHPFTVSKTQGNLVLYPSSQNLYFSKDNGNSYSLIKRLTAGRLFCATISDDANPSVFSGGSGVLLCADSVLTNPKVVELRGIALPVALRISFIGAVKVVPGFRDKIYLSLNNISDSGRVYKVSNVFDSIKYENISGDLPIGLPVNWIECDPLNPEKVIFAGTDFGLYVSENAGKNWIKDTRVPSTVVSSIKVHNNKKDFYVFTHGRGVFRGQIRNNAISNINEESNKIELSLFPNPAKNKLNVLADKFSAPNYKIFDINGKVVSENKLQVMETTINIENLNAGVYFIELKENSQQVVKKFIVNR